MKYSSAIAALMAVSLGYPAASHAQDSIKLGTDPNAGEVRSSFIVFCGPRVISLKLSSYQSNPSVLSDLIVDGKSIINEPRFDELKQFVANIGDPYITSVKCPQNAISFSVAGVPKAGGGNFYRVTIPL
jgi:hypothetical protein